MSICNCYLINFWFTYFEALLLDAYILRIVLYSWWIELFIIMKWPSLLMVILLWHLLCLTVIVPQCLSFTHPILCVYNWSAFLIGNIYLSLAFFNPIWQFPPFNWGYLGHIYLMWLLVNLSLNVWSCYLFSMFPICSLFPSLFCHLLD